VDPAGQGPISPGLAEYLLPRLETGQAGTLQFRQSSDASAVAKSNIDARLARPGNPPRNLFIRVTNTPFDDNNRLLAYVAPDYTEKERQEIPRAERPTFNLDVVTTGWAAPFVIYPSISGELDLPLLIDAVVTAREAERGYGPMPQPC
jgi:hypothetical protein